MWNIIIGLALLVSSLTGQLGIRGKQRSSAAAAVSGVLVMWGIRQMISSRSDQ